VSSAEVAISVEHLSKKYFIKRDQGVRSYMTLRDLIMDKLLVAVSSRTSRTAEIEEFWALKDVTFQVRQGEVLGIIGRNGAGKSTLLKILSRITEPTEGRIHLHGRVGSLLEVGAGFHPELTGRENIFLNGAILGMSRQEIIKKFDEIVAFAEVERFLDVPVKRYSSGMYVRLAFAIAAHFEPDILVVDEVLAVGDREFQQKCLGKMDEVSRCTGRTVLFVSHNLGIVEKLCSNSIWLDRGSVRQGGSTTAVLKDYLSQGTLNYNGAIKLDELPRPYYGGDVFRLISFEWLCDLPLRYRKKAAGRILFEVQSSSAHVAVFFSICDLSGRQILHYDSDLQEPSNPKLCQTGMCAVEFEVNELPLGPDTYSLDVGCCDRRHRQFDFVPGVLQFEVAATPATPEFLSSDRWRCVHLNGASFL
jgi:lipopolysaccharide transport system ATP-binding protein